MSRHGWLHPLLLALALAALLAPAACDQLLVPDPGSSSRLALFDQVWNDFDRFYAHFEVTGVDWQAVRDHYRPLAAQARTDGEFATVLAAMLAELHDPHVTLYTPWRMYQDTATFRPGSYDARVVANYVTTHMTQGGHIAYGFLDAHTGYVRIPSFEGGGWGNEIDAALTALAGATALVVDVRGNGGGSMPTAMDVARRFEQHSGVAEYVRYRSGPAPDDFGAAYPITISPGGARRFDGPVALLTDRRDFSAAEDFVLDMRLSPRVTVVGDTTGGASGRPIVRELPNGWTYRLSTWEALTPQGRPYERIGLAPDIVVHPQPGDQTQGKDRVLEAALATLR